MVHDATSDFQRWHSYVEDVLKALLLQLPIRAGFRISNMRFGAMPNCRQGMNIFRQAGVGTWVLCSVSARRPLRWSMRKIVMRSESWFATSKKVPVGSMAKLRGVWPLANWQPR